MMIRNTRFLALSFLVLLVAGTLSSTLKAQATSLPAAAGATAATTDPAKTEEAPPPEDLLGRSTPRGLVSGFLDAIAKEDFEKAAQYLDIANVPNARRKADAVGLAHDLQTLLDKGGWFYPAAMLSNDRDGSKNDEGIAEDSDRIGNLRGNGKTIDIIAQHMKGDDGNQIWLISAPTLIQLSSLMGADSEAEPLVNHILPQTLIDDKWGGAPIGHWLTMAVLLVASYVVGWFLIFTLFSLIKKFWKSKCSTASGAHFLDEVRLPFALYSAVWIFALSCQYLDISILVRQHMSQLNVIVAWISIALLAWRLIDIFAALAQKKLIRDGRFFGFSSILFFFRRIIKVLLGVIILIVVLNNLGVDVTAGLAALGIGGIALALGAQKTLENFIGSLAIIIDQPLHIGDYCKIGDAAGTVEDIGMRSTRLRTNDRTLITIPNGDLSTQRIENYARRSRFLVNKKFQLRYDGTADQIRALLVTIKDILFAHEKVTQDVLPVRYLGFGTDGHVIEFFFYINTTENNEYLAVQQELMLQILDAVAKAGLYFVIPAQTFIPALDQMGNNAAPLAEKPAEA